ncbi:MAG: hypothetical protein M3O07_00580 [Pseudomonadota bacterium]|nr:hypothetical protein [Pseudomonadota bacterium]
MAQESGGWSFPSAEFALYSARIDLKFRGISSRYQVFDGEVGAPFDQTRIDCCRGSAVTVSSAVWESLHKATLELAKSTPIKQRLTDAFTHHLLDLPNYEIPGELRPDFDLLRQSMTRIPPAHGESAIVATVRKMSIGDADACANLIVGMLDKLHRLLAPAWVAPAAPARPATLSDTGLSRIPTLIRVNRA